MQSVFMVDCGPAGGGYKMTRWNEYCVNAAIDQVFKSADRAAEKHKLRLLYEIESRTCKILQGELRFIERWEDASYKE
jgi:hypothetical protein